MSLHLHYVIHHSYTTHANIKGPHPTAVPRWSRNLCCNSISPLVSARPLRTSSSSSISSLKPFLAPLSREHHHHLHTTATTTASASNGSSEQYDYDLFCIGAGSGGVRASRVAASNYGAKVAICELPFNTIASDTAGGAGGTCVLRGCVPKKLFVYCSSYREAVIEAQGFGWQFPSSNGSSSSFEPTLDWQSFMKKKNAELQRLNNIYDTMLKNSGVEYFEGKGTIVDPHTVEVAGKRHTARHIVIATGGRAFVPDIPGREHCMISDNALEIEQVPKSIAIIGGGYIAVEFAGIFARLGTEVHLICRQPLPLRGFDEEVREFVTEQYIQNGLNFHFHTTPQSFEKLSNGHIKVNLSIHKPNKDGTSTNSSSPTMTSFEVDQVLCATGRMPNTRGLNLEEVGVELGKGGEIKVDEYSQTTVPSIWAIGDVTGRMALTPVALMEAMALTKTLFEGNNDNGSSVKVRPDYENIPTAVFSWPEIGTVGMTEEQAQEAYGDIDIYTSSFKPMRNTISGAPGKTFMKLIVDAKTQRVVGAHMVGPDSAEIMQGVGVAVKMGATKSQFDSTVGIHPSAAEEFVTMRSVTREVRAKVSA